MKKLLCVFLMLLFITGLNAQKGGRTLHYTPKDGLSLGIVNSITQDEKGFIWFATADGLNRFDGTTFKVFKPEPGNKFSLAGNYVQSVFKDSEGIIWVSSRNGLNRYDEVKERFIKFSFPDRSNDITHISESVGRNLWISSGYGFYYFNKKSHRFINYTTANLPGLPSNYILNTFQDSHGLIWVGTQNAGVKAFQTRNKKLIPVNSIDASAISSLRINSVFEDHLQNIWITTSRGLVWYKRKDNRFFVFNADQYHLKSNVSLSLAEDQHQHLLIGLQDGGLYKLDLSTTQNTLPENFVFEQVKGEKDYNITPRSVQALFQDKDKNSWVGTYGGGVYMISSQSDKFQKFQQKQTDVYGDSYLRFYGMCLDSDGLLWLGTDGDGIYKTDATGKTMRHYKADGRNGSITDNAIIAAFTDSKNNLWFGTYSKGLFLYSKSTDSFINFSHQPADKNSLGANDVRVIFEDSRQNLWIGTNGGGLSLYNPATRNFKNYNQNNSSINANDIRSLDEDTQGNLFVGTYGGGVNYFDRKANRFYQNPNGAGETTYSSNDVVFSLYLDTNERLWIGTEGNGLMVFDRKKHTIEKFTEKDGLANNTVYAIKPHGNNLWISTNKGISKINLATYKIENFDESDGLQGGQFNEGSVAHSKSGDFMCFGGTEGWNLFYPDKVKQSSYKPRVLITGLQIFGKQVEVGRETGGSNVLTKNINETEEIVLQPDQSVFTIQYTALNYAYPREGEFAYKLVGLDKAWNFVKNQKSATYRYLAPGDYVFMIKASNQDDVWNENYKVIKIKVLPPWYKTWWAYLFYMGLAAAVIYWYIKYKTDQSKLKFEIKLAHIEAENEKELHEKKLSFFTNISHEFRTPLTLIINPVKELLSSDGKNTDLRNLNVVYRNARRLLSLVDQLLLFRKAESEADKLKLVKLNLVSLCKEVYLCFIHQAQLKNIQYEFVCGAEVIEIVCDREKIEIALFNLISNALKFTPEDGAITFTVTETDEQATISVKDTGTGIAENTGAKLFESFYQEQTSANSNKGGFGIGLFLVKNFIDSHYGEISYNSEPAVGTTFFVSLLKGTSHFKDQYIYENAAENSVLLEELAEGLEETAHPVVDNRPADDILEDLSSDTRTILIVEDNVQIRQYVMQIFENDYTVLEADNGDDGLKMVNQYLPDIIISDVMMQGLSGMELCTQIKENPSLSHIPIILLTASSSSEAKLQGIECGADDYITKPFEKELLQARVAGILKSRNTLQSYFYNEITLKSNNLKISKEYKDFLDRCMQIVEDHLTDPEFGIKVLAEEIGMSKSNLYVKIKSISGQSSNSFIRFIRLRKAAEIFISTDSTVYETAYLVGIKDLKYFREQFHKQFNMNPSDYIKKYRKPFHNNFNLNKEIVRKG